MDLETKAKADGLESTATETRNGVRVGIVKGYLATWAPDKTLGRYGKPDVFLKGAFAKSIEDHKSRGGRPIRLKDNHGRTIGGFPIENVREDDRGLYGEGEINLEVSQGSDVHALAKQGVLTDFSIGFKAKRDNLAGKFREISEAIIGEASIVSEPMNPGSVILEVKHMNSNTFMDLELAPPDTEFDETKARENVDEMPYRVGNGDNAFLDGDRKHLFADVINDKLVAVPNAIRKLAIEIKADDSNKEIIQHLERYLAKMNLKSPYETKQFHSLDEVKGWDIVDFEKALRETGSFSKSAAKYLVHNREPLEVKEDEQLTDVLSGLNELKSLFNQGQAT